MKYFTFYNREHKKVVVTGENNYPISGYSPIGSFKHAATQDPLGHKVSHVIYHHVRHILYPQGAHDMSYHQIFQNGGTSGDVSSITFDTTALRSQSAFKVIWQSDHELADALDVLRLNDGIGITVSNITQGQPCEIILSGVVTNTLWNWIPGKPLYLDHNGDMTQSYVPGSKLLGNALTEDTIYFSPGFLSEATPPNVLEVVSTAVRSGHKLVFVSDLAYVSPTNTSRSGELIGLTRNAAGIGDPISILLEGPITHSAWTFTPGSVVYMGINGSIIETPTLTGLWWPIGNAIDATSIFFKPQQPIIRS